MNSSSTITKLAMALAKAQLKIGAAEKGAENPFFKSRYADLGSVMAACKEPLLAQGISVLQLVNFDDHGAILETVLLHETGEFIASLTRIVVSKKDDPQAMGSAITYSRRYALQAAVFMPSVDDDAEWAERALRHRGEETIDERREREAREVASRGGTITEIEPELVTTTAIDTTTGTTATATYLSGDWRKVKSHVGKAGGPLLGKELGEVPSHLIKWLAENWLPKLGAKPTKKDQTLALAVRQAVEEGAHLSKTDSAASPEPDDLDLGPTPPAAKEKPVASPPEPKTMEWRSVECLTFGSTSAAIVGKTLGELPTTVMRSVRKQLVPKAEAGGSPKEKVFVNAVNAGCAELMVDADSPALLNEIAGRFDAMKLEQWQAVALLIEAGLLSDKDTLRTTKEETLRYILETWPEVKRTIGGMTPPKKA